MKPVVYLNSFNLARLQTNTLNNMKRWINYPILQDQSDEIALPAAVLTTIGQLLYHRFTIFTEARRRVEIGPVVNSNILLVQFYGSFLLSSCSNILLSCSMRLHSYILYYFISHSSILLPFSSLSPSIILSMLASLINTNFIFLALF